MSTWMAEDYRSKRGYDVTTESVTISTIHQAKGLEFPVVFIVGVEEGILPHHNSLEKGGAAIEEERRLMYVAVTRAMKKLVVTYCERRNGKEAMPSRFIAEMRS